jgi:hypothetical protein
MTTGNGTRLDARRAVNDEPKQPRAIPPMGLPAIHFSLIDICFLDAFLPSSQAQRMPSLTAP